MDEGVKKYRRRGKIQYKFIGTEIMDHSKRNLRKIVNIFKKLDFPGYIVIPLNKGRRQRYFRFFTDMYLGRRRINLIIQMLREKNLGKFKVIKKL